jgi:hypothetical protein
MDAGATQIMRPDAQSANAANASAPTSFVPAPPPAPMPAAAANVSPQPSVQLASGPKPERNRNPALVGAAAAAGVLALAAGGWLYVQQDRAVREPAAASLAVTSAAAPSLPPPPAVSPPPPAPAAPSAPSQVAVATPPPVAAPAQAVQQPSGPADTTATETQAKKEPPAKRQASLAPPAPPRPAFFKTSFDCMHAASTAEHLVCSDNELASLDLQMADLYRRGLASVVDTNEFAGEQRTWLTQRDVCADKPCLISSYSGRIKELQRWVIGQ